jgi:hypothetical protein
MAAESVVSGGLATAVRVRSLAQVREKIAVETPSAITALPAFSLWADASS